MSRPRIPHGAWSAEALERAADEGPLAINPLIYAEVSIGFATIEELDDALPPETYVRIPLPYEAGFLAGKAFLTYRRRTAPLPAGRADLGLVVANISCYVGHVTHHESKIGANFRSVRPCA